MHCQIMVTAVGSGEVSFVVVDVKASFDWRSNQNTSNLHPWDLCVVWGLQT